MFIIPQQQGIGEILGQGLNDVVSHWADKHTTAKALRGLGFSDVQAKAYSHFSPQIQQEAIAAKQREQQKQEANRVISQILGEELPQPQYQQSMNQFQQQPQQQTQMMQQPRQERQQQAIQEATSVLQNPAFRKLQEQQQQGAALQQQQLAQQFGQSHGKQQPTPEQNAIAQAESKREQKEKTPKERLEQIRNQKRALASAGLSPIDRLFVQNELTNQESALRREMEQEKKQSLEERKFGYQKQKNIDKETLPTYQKINESAKGAYDSNLRLGRMEKLIDDGRVQSGVFFRGLQALEEVPYIGKLAGIISAAVTNTNTQEFKKLSADFVKDAKQFFGSRVTENEVQLFLETVPSLVQTADGQKRVIHNMRLVNEAAKVRKSTMDELIKENNGERPMDLESLIEKRSSEKLDNIAKRFVDEIRDTHVSPKSPIRWFN
jgi:hypothetical protein